MCNKQNVLFKILKESVNVTLDKHEPIKKKYVNNNQSPYMNKKLRKSHPWYKKSYWQKSDIVSLLKNENNNFYSNLVTKVVTDNRVFSKNVKPFLSEKVTKHLDEDDKITSRDDLIAKKF